MLSLFRDKELRATFAVFALVSIFILTAMFSSAFPWFVFYAMVSIAGIVILIVPRAGFFSIFFLTMIWERFFTLQSVVFSGHLLKLYPLDIIIMFTAIATVLHWIIERKNRKLLRHPHAPAPSLVQSFGAFEKLLIMFAFGAMMYFFYAQVVGVHEPEIAFSTFKSYAFYPLLTFLVLALLRTPEDFLRLMRVLMIGGVAVLTFLAIGLLRGEGLWTEFNPLSTEGVRYVAFTHAYYLTIVLLVMMSAWAHQRFARPWLALGLMGVQLVGILASLMRHLWVAFAVGASMLVATAPSVTRRQALRWLFIALLAGTSVALLGVASALFLPASGLGQASARFIDPLIARFASFGRITEDLSALWRLQLWQATFSRWIEHPWFGIGFGQEVTFAVRGYVSTVRMRDLHNSLFAILAQTGIAGFGVFVALQVALFVGYFRRRAHMGALRPWADGVLAAYVAVLVATNFQPYLEINMFGSFFWLLMGMVRVAPFLFPHLTAPRGHLHGEKHLRALEGAHNRGTLFR